ncbi:hypothetical protein [Conexibacter sp. W3-3-2]|uniref:hypothetical protein n=1 Tax=Conexibacter sp. W3-3-2 TaxID=2675227 RepID=UPI001E2E3EC8|nr:hypothetical protein [Conexibacter sp. W3-3-2]
MDDPWAVFRLPGRNYALRTLTDRLDLVEQVASLVREVEADVQVLRVARWWDAGRMPRPTRRPRPGWG